jgi:hypothetical protein
MRITSPGLPVMLIGRVLIFDLVLSHKGADHDVRDNADRDHHLAVMALLLPAKSHRAFT